MPRPKATKAVKAVKAPKVAPVKKVIKKAKPVPKVDPKDRFLDKHRNSMNMPAIRDPILQKEIGKDYHAIPTYWIARKAMKDWEDVSGPNVAAHLKKHLNPKKVNIFTPGHGAGEHGTHYVTTIIDPKKKKIKVLDPGSGTSSATYGGGETMGDKIHDSLGKKIYKEPKYVKPVIPIQRCTDDVFCQTHSVKLAKEYVEAKKGKKRKAASTVMSSYDKKSKTEPIKEVHSYIDGLHKKYPHLKDDVNYQLKNDNF
jgi:hypothetical protein